MGVILIIGIVIVYLIPAIIAQGKRNSVSILLLNLFLGWTFIGWVVALVWACAHEDRHLDKKELELIRKLKGE